MPEPARYAPPRRRGLALVGVVATGAALVAVGAVTAGPASAATKCTVNFSVSNDHPAVGQNITLRWTTSGADKLIASWTTAGVPFSGTQVTTEQMPGPVSYQVTGLNSGQYCGGAVVNVVYAAVVSSGTPTPVPTAPSSSASSSASSTSASSTVAPTPTSVAPSSSSVTYPAQSPTGGTTTPWWEQPLNLLVIGTLSLFGSIALFNRGRVRALLVRRH